jgi:branched-subunit amino acid aminotransferase/4-amino-4-deoxychorismate lyase
MLYVNNNEKIIPADEFSVSSNSRAFMYGDGVFESIRIRNGRAINVENHIKRLIEGAKVLRMQVPNYFNASFFETRINDLCNRSEIQEGGICRLSLERISGGRYKPLDNSVQFFIDVRPLETNDFSLNSKGLEVDIYTDLKKQKNSLSNFKTKNGLLYIMASLRAQERELDDLLITNDTGGIIESSNSNLFVVSNGVLYTPGLEDGCLAGTMRMQIINLALRNNMRVYESNIVPQNLLVADEVFLTNASSGIIWVGGYRTKRYFNNTSRKLIALLNEYWANNQ